MTAMTLTPLMEDQSEAETEHSGIISGYETDVQVLLDQVGSVKIELGTEGDDEADQVSESPRHVLRPHRRNNVVSKLAKLHTVGTTGYVRVGKCISMSHCIAIPPSK